MALCQNVLLYMLHRRPITNQKRKKKYNQPSSSLPLVPLFALFLHQADSLPTYTIYRIFYSLAQKWKPYTFFLHCFFFFFLPIHCFCFRSFLLYLCLHCIYIYIYIYDSFVSKPIIAYETNAEKRLKFDINKR